MGGRSAYVNNMAAVYHMVTRLCLLFSFCGFVSAVELW